MNGFGRGIAAPQIGIGRRFLAVNMGDEQGTRLLSDPIITWKSHETFTMYDDCMEENCIVCGDDNPDEEDCIFCDFYCWRDCDTI